MNPREAERYATAIAVILKHEGGLSDNSQDPGGITNFGITLPFLQEYYNKIKLIKKATANDIRNLTKDKASEIYRVLLWEQFQYDLLKALPIAIKVFDMAVNMGYTRAHKILQKAINYISTGPVKLEVDGVLGPKTRASANILPPDVLHESLRDQQKAFYYRLVDQHPNMKWALIGWVNRAAW